MPEVSFDFGDWDVESLRMSIFFPRGAHPNVRAGLWERVTGEQPDSIDSRPRERISRETGTIGGNSFVFVNQDERIDWLLQPIVVPSLQPPTSTTLPTLETVEKALAIFRNAIRYSLETIPVVQRLAFAPVLIKDAANLNVGFGQLSTHLPHLSLGSAYGADFIYQINRRRRSNSVPHAQINRLAKWSMEMVGGVAVRMGPSGQPDVRDTGTSATRKLALDINTTPETSTISKAKIPGLFEELVTVSRELATKGDIS